MFNTEWEKLYFFFENIDNNAQCLICKKILSRATKYCIKRHYIACHKDFALMVGEERERMFADLKQESFDDSERQLKRRAKVERKKMLADIKDIKKERLDDSEDTTRKPMTIYNVNEALEHVKALLEYAMFNENYRAISLLTEAEKAFIHPPDDNDFEDKPII